MERGRNQTVRGQRISFVSSRTLWTISRASTSFLQFVGLRHRRRFPNQAFSVANLDYAALRRWYHAPHRFGNRRAKRVIRSKASTGWVGQRAFFLGEKYGWRRTSRAAAHAERVQYAESPVRACAKIPGGTPSKRRPSWVESCHVPRVTRTASVPCVVAPERMWSLPKSRTASGSWFDRHAPEPKRTRPVASTARTLSTAQNGRAVSASRFSSVRVIPSPRLYFCGVLKCGMWASPRLSLRS